MKSHLFKVKQMGVFALAGLAWLVAVSEIETIFGLGLSVQSAVLLLTFRWYGRAKGVSLAVAASLHHYIFLHNALAAILCLAVILFAAACQKWIEGKGLALCSCFLDWHWACFDCWSLLRNAWADADRAGAGAVSLCREWHCECASG